MERRNILKKFNRMNKIAQKYNRKKEILMKPKQIYVSLMTSAILLSAVTPLIVNADVVTSNVTTE